MVGYIYTSRISLTLDMAKRVILASVSLNIPTLKNVCEKFLLETIESDVASCRQTGRLAKLHHFETIAESAWNKMLNNCKELFSSSAFLEMTEGEAIEYISDDKLNVPNENAVFEAVTDWVRHDLEKRKGSIQVLLEHVRLDYCSLDYLIEVVVHEDLMMTRDSKDRLLETFKHIKCRTHTDTLAEGGKWQVKPRNSYALVPTLVACGHNYVWLMGRDNKWNANSSHSSSVTSACLIREGIMITCEKAVYIFRTATLDWGRFPSLDSSYQNAVAIRNTVYVLDRACHIGKYLDESRAKWNDINSPPADVGFTVICVGHKRWLYTFGSKSYSLDTILHQWTERALMPKVDRKGSALSVNDKIYVVGSRCLSYDPSLNQWTEHAKPTNPIYRLCFWEDGILLGSSVRGFSKNTTRNLTRGEKATSRPHHGHHTVIQQGCIVTVLNQMYIWWVAHLPK